MAGERTRRLGGLGLAAALVAAPIGAAAVLGPSSVLLGLFSALGPLAAVVVALWTFRSALRRWLTRELEQVAGSSIVAALPPRVVLDALLQRIYGPGRYDSILAGILGGAGLDVHGRDIATSRRTVVDVRLSSIDDTNYDAVFSWTHRLAGALGDYRFVVFATCDPTLWNALPSRRRVPLYESWYADDEDMLAYFVPNLLRKLKVGISYLDRDGVLHRVEPRAIRCTQPPMREWGDYLLLPDGADVENLRILEFDLGQLFDEEHVVAGIETVTMQAASVEQAAHGYLSWTPPYPCFVERIRFDVEELVEREHLLFKILPFTMEKPGPTAANVWVEAQKLSDLVLESWLLPGHGVILLWRPSSSVSDEVLYGP